MGACLDKNDATSFSVSKKKTEKEKERVSSDISIDNPRISLRDFIKKGKIGTGTTSTVFLVEKEDTGKNYAMKVMKRSIKYK